LLEIFQSGLQTTLAIIVALGILVGIHEWGHFIVARMCGVKVLKFSIGFGQSLYSRVDKKGTEFVIAWIPLGGFVKMVDEREGEVSEEDLPYAFNRKSASQRIAIVAAGPFINLLFATLVYWIVFMGGQQVLSPIVGSIASNSLAEQAGLQIKEEVISVDGVSVNSWDDFIQQVVLKVLEPGSIEIEVRGENQTQKTRRFQLDEALTIDENTDPLLALGIRPELPQVPAIIGDLVEGEAALRDGLQVGDEILAVNGEAIVDWAAWVEAIQAHANKEMRVELLRKEALVEINLTPGIKQGGAGESYGFIGAGAAPYEWPEHLFKQIEYNPAQAFYYALKKTWHSSVLILVSTWKLAVGDLAADNLGGPIMIAKLAGRYADYGFQPYLMFVAYISIVLGVMNLLPIPVLDGGHILFYSIELIAGRPIPEKIQNILMRVGLTILLLIMSFAIFNDISRIFTGRL
jgi:regulator of sigma E protease